ncbi:MAG: SAM-dependent methyltransferase [Ruminococcaceae bacterium]|nr:SAM-dependent methyltransferase [Oscillospiraceae bacterium]
MQNEKITEFAALIQKSVSSKTLVSVTFHSSSSREHLKAKGIMKKIGGEDILQIETSLTEGRVAQENIKKPDIIQAAERYLDTYKKADLTDRGGTALLMISKKGAVTLLKKGKIGEGEAQAEDSHGNDRVKKRLLTGEEKFLKELGVSDSSGRVHDKKQSKFRQISRFAEYIVEAEKKLRRDGEIYVCDLCCGKSYLSFAAYHVLTEICGREVKMTCVDLKQSVMDYCSDIAERCSMNGMEFLCMDIGEFVPERSPDLVISLHACDIATDIVLNFASKYRADVILSTPCCHHRMNNELDCAVLDFIAQRSILKQKLCTAATDALRLMKLEAEGYKTDATELIDPEDTPKNVMLRAHRIKNFDPSSADAIGKKEKYDSTFKFLYGKSPAGSDAVIVPSKN